MEPLAEMHLLLREAGSEPNYHDQFSTWHWTQTGAPVYFLTFRARVRTVCMERQTVSCANLKTYYVAPSLEKRLKQLART